MASAAASAVVVDVSAVVGRLMKRLTNHMCCTRSEAVKKPMVDHWLVLAAAKMVV